MAEEGDLKKGIETKIAERNKNLQRLLEEKEKSEKSGVEIGRKIEDDRQKLESFFATRKRKTESIVASRGAIEDNKRKIKEAEGELDRLRALLEEVIRKLVDAIDRRKAELEGSERERSEVRRSIDARLDAIGTHSGRPSPASGKGGPRTPRSAGDGRSGLAQE